MDRLTKYQQTEGGIPFVDAEDNQEALQLLAQYEDIFEQHCITDIKDLEERLLHFFVLKSDILDELEYYRKLKEDGRLIELPCKVGNKLWYYHDDPDDQPYVRQDEYGIAGIAIKRDGFYAICSDGCMDKIGTQYAMLTKEEAEKAWRAQHDQT